MAVKQLFTSVPLSAVSFGHFAAFVGTSYAAQLQINIAGDWLPAVAANVAPGMRRHR